MTKKRKKQGFSLWVSIACANDIVFSIIDFYDFNLQHTRTWRRALFYAGIRIDFTHWKFELESANTNLQS